MITKVVLHLLYQESHYVAFEMHLKMYKINATIQIIEEANELAKVFCNRLTALPTFHFGFGFW
jgi:hypothetical protein